MMRRPVKHHAKVTPEEGQATVELVALIPILGLFLLLIAYSGWWTYARLAAQNAAYSGASYIPRERYGFAGNSLAQRYTVQADEGMKRMWESSAADIYAHKEQGWGREGGSGMTVFVSNLGWRDFFETFVWGQEDHAPKGSAFFLYSPFISAGSDYGWITPDG